MSETTNDKRKTILIVDDDEDILAAVSGALEDEGYGTACATNGAVALAYLKSSPPPCMILLDLMMPVMDGWAFRHEQKQDPDWAGICTTVMTAFKNLQDRAVEADHFLPKPLRVEALLELVAECCAPAPD
jgi:CheY-like chemotaxis protein